MDWKRMKANLYIKQRQADKWGEMARLNKINRIIYKINEKQRREREQEIIKRREARYARMAEQECERGL